MRNFIFLVIGSLLFLGTLNTRAAEGDGDGSEEQVLFNAQTDSVRYVIIYKEAADLFTGPNANWKFEVMEAKDGELQQKIQSETFTLRSEAKAAQKRTLEKLKQKGFVDASLGNSLDGQADLAMQISPRRNGATAQQGNNPIWQVVDQWTWQREVEYAKWVKSLDKFFFYKHKIATDCADVVIGLRWIFARMKGLPAANTLTSSGAMVGHMTESKYWSGLPTAKNWNEDQRFMTALRYIMEQTYTGSLKRDSYPIRISKEFLIPGTHHLEINPEGGHAFIVLEVDASMPAKISYMESTLPAEVRVLRRKDYSHATQPGLGNGFLKQMWPVLRGGTWSFLSPEDHPAYSEEQYTEEFMGAQSVFAAAVHNHLRGANNNQFNLRSFKTTVELIRQKLMLRAKTVVEGEQACRSINCSEGSEGWEEWSTPGADSKLKKDIKTALNAVQVQQNRDAVNEWNKMRNKELDLRYRGIKITNGQAIDLLMSGRTNVDPRQSVMTRWGL